MGVVEMSDCGLLATGGAPLRPHSASSTLKPEHHVRLEHGGFDMYLPGSIRRSSSNLFRVEMLHVDVLGILRPLLLYE
jgi:hypothetical protein